MTAPPVFVIPFENHLLEALTGQQLVVRTHRAEDIPFIADAAAQLRCALEAVILDTASPVTALPFEDGWKAVPLLVHAPELGRVSHLLPHLPVIRGMSLRFMLPTEGGENYASLRILSSLGIPSGFVLKGETVDWEQLLDLTTYYYFNFASHAPISPLDAFGDHYAPGEGSPFGSAYLESPASTYFHVSVEGEVALSQQDLKGGNFLYPSLEALAEDRVQSVAEGGNHTLTTFFLAPGPCPTCPALKLCRRRVAADDGSVPDGCSSFFSELMGMIEEYQAMRDGRGG